jgi:hypothetical protein
MNSSDNIQIISLSFYENSILFRYNLLLSEIAPCHTVRANRSIQSLFSAME